MHEHKTGLSGHTLLMLPAASISLLTMNVAPSAAGASMDNIIQNYPGTKWNFADILAFYQATKNFGLLHTIAIINSAFCISRAHTWRKRNAAKHQKKEIGASPWNITTKRWIDRS